MDPLIIVEGTSDEALLTRLSKHLGLRSRVVTAQGASSAVAMARSHLSMGAPRVILVLDADSERQEEVEERRRSVEAALAYAAPKERWGLVLLVPDLDRSLLSVAEVAHFLLRKRLDGTALKKLQATASLSKEALGLERTENLRRLREKLPQSAAEAFLDSNPELRKALRPSLVATAA